jgi:hypothetical protein
MSRYNESDGQAHCASRLLRTLSLASPSITHRLRVSRVRVSTFTYISTMATGFTQIWAITNRRKINYLFAIERRFPTYSSVDHFCTGLQTIADLCTCKSVQWYHNFLFEKSHICVLKPVFRTKLTNLQRRVHYVETLNSTVSSTGVLVIILQ